MKPFPVIFSALFLSSSMGFAQPPQVINQPTQIWWGAYQNNSQLADAGATQWPTVQQHMDGFILHGAYWNYPANSPSPALLGPKIANLVNAHQKPVLLEHLLAGEYPDIDSAFGTATAGNPGDAAGFGSAIANIKRLQSYGFPQPDISTDYIMTAWQEAVRWHPEWTSKEFFTALTGSWDTYQGSQFNKTSGSTDRIRYGWFRQWVERLGETFPDIRVSTTNSPVYFNWNDGTIQRRELGGSLNHFYTWLKLERRGDLVTAHYSGDGHGWAPLGSTTVSLGTSPLAGIFTASLNSNRLAQGRLDHLRVLPFFTSDIGRPGRGGSVTAADSLFTLKSNGNEFLHPGNNTSDAQFLTYRDWTGNGSFTIRLDSLTNSNSNRTNPNGEIASAGITLRESTAANARQVSLLTNFANQLEFLARTTTSGGLSAVSGSGSPIANLGVNTTPRWLRLTRSENTIEAHHSIDGASWTSLGSATVNMPSTIQIGIFADSQVRYETATAVFSNVTFLTQPSTQFSGTNIGSAGTGAASSVSGSTYTLKAAGSGHSGASDAFHLHSSAFTGDGTLLARLTYFADETSPATPLAGGAQLGITLRANSTTGSPHATITFTPQLGLRTLSRSSAAGPTAETATYGVGEISIQPLGSNYRPLLHYFTGNDFLQGLNDAFPGNFSKNYAGFTSDSPYGGYQKWGGSETHPDAILHREKIILYERWLQQRGREHHFIANSTGSEFSEFNTSTQAGRDAWDALYKQHSLRSIQLHQLEGGRPDKVYFESWYEGPYTMVPETQPGTFTNLVRDSILYIKGLGQNLDLLVRPDDQPLFSGASIYQNSPTAPQRVEWRARSNVSQKTFFVRLTNRGSVDAYPVIHSHESGAGGWQIHYDINGANVSSSLRSASGLALTDSTTRGSELIAPGASVDLTITASSISPTNPRNLLIRAFWNPQDPTKAVRDSVEIILTPPDATLTEGIAGDWPFDGNFNDQSGLSRHLTAVGSASISSDPLKLGSGSLNLNASGANAVSQQAIELGNSFTISAWIHLPSGPASIRTIAANSASGFNTDGFRFYVNGFNTSDGKLVLETGNGTAALSISSATGAVAFDRWQHVAAVIHRSTGNATLFRDGQPVANGSIRNDFLTNALFRTGAMHGNGNSLRGTLDELRLHSRALSSAEVIAIASQANLPPTLSGPASLTLPAGSTSAALNITIDDVEQGPDRLTLTAATSNPSLLPLARIILSGSGTNRTVTVNPVAWLAGVATVTLTLSDGISSTNATFDVTVSNDGSSAQWIDTGTASPMPWSTNTHWLQFQPPYPGKSCALVFLSDTSLPQGKHVCHQDMANPFSAFRLTLDGTGPGNAAFSLQGNPVSLVSNGSGTPSISLAANGTMEHLIELPLQLTTTTQISGDGAATFDFRAPISGNAGLVKSGTSRLILSSSNSFNGSISIQGGTLRATHGSALGTAAANTTLSGGNALAALELGGGITVAEPLQMVMHNTVGHSQLRNISGSNILEAQLSLNSGGARWDIACLNGSLTLSGPVVNIATGTDTWRTLFLEGPGNGIFAGPITDSASGNSKTNLSIGSGSWTFSGPAKSYTGATTIHGGRLTANSSVTSTITVQANGTLDGAGNLATVLSYGTISAGVGVGTLSTGSLTLHSGSKLVVNLEAWHGNPGTGYDQIQASSLQLTATPMDRITIAIDASSLSGFAEISRTFPILTTIGSITGFAPDRIHIITHDFKGSGKWSIQQNGSTLELAYQPTPYQTWISGFSALSETQRLPSADPDGDGINNQSEFAFGGSPVTSNPLWGIHDLHTISAGDIPRLRITHWVRAGALFSSDDSPVAGIDGLIYQVIGSKDLMNNRLAVEAAPLPQNLPASPAGYEPRSFRLKSTLATEPRGFLKMEAKPQ
jgi:autotransporter-associated beta strand protein